jgi:O-antigen/teichoic acid export membrane protein
MGTLKKNFFYAFGAQGLHFVQSVLWSMLIPKLLGVEEFGYWQLFIFYTQYGGFLHFGLIDGIYLREGGKEYRQLDYSSLGYQLRMFSIWQILILLVFVYIGLINVTPARTYTILASCLFIFLSNIMCFLMYVLQAVNDIKSVALGKILMTLFFVAFTVFLLGFKITHFEPYIICYIISNIACEIYYIAKSKEIVKAVFVSSKASYRIEMMQNVKMGIVLLLANICGMLILGYGRFLVDQTWGIKSFAVVSFAFMFVNFFMTFVMQASLVLFPELKRWDVTKVNAFYIKMRGVLALYLPMVLLLYMPIYYFVQFWLPQYLESVKYLLYLMPLCIFDTKMNLLCNTLFKVFNQVRQLLLCNLIALFCSVCAISISIFYFNSLKAVIISMLLSIAVRSVVAEVLLAKSVGVKNIGKNIIGELILIFFFVIMNSYMNVITSFAVYLIVMMFYFIYEHRMRLMKSIIKGTRL